MSKRDTLIPGFWFSYIDALALLATVFIILLIVGNFRAINITKSRQKVIEAIDKIKPALLKMHAQPREADDQGGWEITIAENILFNTNSVEITSGGKYYLESISNILRNSIEKDTELLKITRVIIGGHADIRGADSYNLFLSDIRANNVAYLLRQKLPSVNMEAIGYGEKNPKSKNNHNVNRRVTILIRPVDVELFGRNCFPKKYNYTTDSDFKKLWNPSKKSMTMKIDKKELDTYSSDTLQTQRYNTIAETTVNDIGVVMKQEENEKMRQDNNVIIIKQKNLIKKKGLIDKIIGLLK